MHLRDAGAAQGAGVEMGERRGKRHAQPALHYPPHLVHGHGRRLRAQLLQLLAVGAGKHVWAHGHNLPKLNKGRPKVL